MVCAHDRPRSSPPRPSPGWRRSQPLRTPRPRPPRRRRWWSSTPARAARSARAPTGSSACSRARTTCWRSPSRSASGTIWAGTTPSRSPEFAERQRAYSQHAARARPLHAAARGQRRAHDQRVRLGRSARHLRSTSARADAPAGAPDISHHPPAQRPRARHGRLRRRAAANADIWLLALRSGPAHRRHHRRRQPQPPHPALQSGAVDRTRRHWNGSARLVRTPALPARMRGASCKSRTAGASSPPPTRTAKPLLITQRRGSSALSGGANASDFHIAQRIGPSRRRGC